LASTAGAVEETGRRAERDTFDDGPFIDDTVTVVVELVTHFVHGPLLTNTVTTPSLPRVTGAHAPDHDAFGFLRPTRGRLDVVDLAVAIIVETVAGLGPLVRDDALPEPCGRTSSNARAPRPLGASGLGEEPEREGATFARRPFCRGAPRCALARLGEYSRRADVIVPAVRVGLAAPPTERAHRGVVNRTHGVDDASLRARRR
jgi:hypothetical protein